MAAINQDDNTGFSNPPKQAGTTPSTDQKAEDYGVEMEPGKFIDHKDGTGTFVPDTPSPKSLDDILADNNGYPVTDKTRAALENLLTQERNKARIRQIKWSLGKLVKHWKRTLRRLADE